MFFHAQFQTHTCFETSRAVWVPKHLRFAKIFFSVSIQLKPRLGLQISSLQHVLESYDTCNKSPV